MSKDTIRRAKHGKTTPYFSMSRTTAQDKNLSYEARGMLCYFLSKPDDWQVHINDLILKDSSGTTRTGKSKVYGILSELADAGYIVKPQRYTDEKGRIQWTPYEVYEQPIDSSKTPLTDLPDMVSPDMAEPSTEKPHNKIIESTERFAEEENRKEEDTPVTQPTVDADETSSSADLSNVFKAYEGNISTISMAIRDKLISALDDYPTEWIVEAIEQSAVYNKRSWAYCVTILERWKREGRTDKNGKKDAKPVVTGFDASSLANFEYGTQAYWDEWNRLSAEEDRIKAEKLARYQERLAS